MGYIIDKFRGIFLVNEPPHRIALAFAVGAFWGISPLVGLHYLMGLASAILFRLNKLITVCGVSVSNPWTIVPISTFCIWFGAKLLNIKQVLPEIDWANLNFISIAGTIKDWEQLSELLIKLKPALISFFLGSFVVGTISAIFSYVIVLRLAKKYQQNKHLA
ncbi:MAG: DUF2062 domain-containing protein [Nitrospira sp.]|nr:DUF2062 domain-containing protein [bacterium]MBL7050352.1 DUF2062 domain-containing protein [Nitrospira sp.]